MMLKKSFFIGIILILATMTQAQDIHYSLYQFTPIDVNPANAGSFSGSYRVNAIYSDKDPGFFEKRNNFRTVSVSVDAPIIRGFRKQDWVGAGIKSDVFARSGSYFESPGVLADRSLTNWTNYALTLAYHLSLDKKQTNILTLGGQMNSGNIAFNSSANLGTRVQLLGLNDLDVQQFVTLAQGDPGGADATDRPMIRITNRDVNAGLLFNAKRKSSDLRIGFAVEGILRPNRSVNNATRIERKYIGINFHGAYEVALNKRVNLTPGFYYYQLGPANALNVNSHVSYLLDPEKTTRVSAGLGMRNLRDAMLFLGAEYKDFRFGFAYDYNLSTKAIASGGLGGFELAVGYLGKIYRKPKVKPVIFCPSL